MVVNLGCPQAEADCGLSCFGGIPIPSSPLSAPWYHADAGLSAVTKPYLSPSPRQHLWINRPR
jgi:hypothetical protein